MMSEWRDLALKFDGQRIQFREHLRAIQKAAAQGNEAWMNELIGQIDALMAAHPQTRTVEPLDDKDFLNAWHAAMPHPVQPDFVISGVSRSVQRACAQHWGLELSVLERSAKG